MRLSSVRDSRTGEPSSRTLRQGTTVRRRLTGERILKSRYSFHMDVGAVKSAVYARSYILDAVMQKLMSKHILISLRLRR
ncbi:MAG: DUF3155 domain-containing protein [Bacteroidales bacterium]|nr:DUF3155 domain-containing protein [Bacteroidales bacterium]